jgi:hypothetical protein
VNVWQNAHTLETMEDVLMVLFAHILSDLFDLCDGYDF